MSAGFAQTIADWLPHPVYLFVGGPKDGQRLTVTVHETERGMEPPRFWRVRHAPAVRLGDAPPEAVEVHVYRFVPDPGSINAGRYEFCP